MQITTNTTSFLAGTYDEHWLNETRPFLPADFDDQYFQAAPQWLDDAKRLKTSAQTDGLIPGEAA
jgi:hypothetical protein